MFGRLKNWRRVATRYDRCPKAFLSPIALAALIIYWLWVLNISHADRASKPVKAGIINFFISVLLSMSTYSEKKILSFDFLPNRFSASTLARHSYSLSSNDFPNVNQTWPEITHI